MIGASHSVSCAGICGSMWARPCASLPGLTSPSLTRGPIHLLRKKVLRSRMDPRGKPAGDARAFFAFSSDGGSLVGGLRIGEAIRRKRFSTIVRSEEHTSELQSPDHLVCPLLL